MVIKLVNVIIYSQWRRNSKPGAFGLHFACATLICTLLMISAIGAAEDRPLDASFRTKVIDSICSALITNYAFPEVAEEMAAYLRKSQSDGIYDTVSGRDGFASILNEHLQAAGGDQHLEIEFVSDELIAEWQAEPTDDEIELMFLKESYFNFDFDRVERLSGNVGYIKMHGFSDADWAGPTAEAAMNFIGHCNAVIFDLRNSLGGSPTMVQLLLSYLFDEPTHINSFRYPAEDREKQFWTQASVRGPRMTKTKVFVLTNKNTVSAAEEFAYDVKHLGRGLIVGETTKGGAFPARSYVVANVNLVLTIPYGYAVNPVTGTNWERGGVQPDVITAPEDALNVAYMMALESLRDECTIPEHCADLDWAIAGLKATMNPVLLTEDDLLVYVGTFGRNTIDIQEGKLIISKKDGTYSTLKPMGNDLFGRPDLEFLRYQFIRDEHGDISGLATLIYGGGRRETPKNK